MDKHLPNLGHLMINDETICVAYARSKYGVTLQIRPMRGAVLGLWLKDESEKIKSSPPKVLRKLRAGEIIHL